MFRHGDRTMDRLNREFYPNDPYNSRNFYPVGDGDLTNVRSNLHFLHKYITSFYFFFIIKIIL